MYTLWKYNLAQCKCKEFQVKIKKVKESTARPDIVSQQPNAFQYQEATYWILILLEVKAVTKEVKLQLLFVRNFTCMLVYLKKKTLLLTSYVTKILMAFYYCQWKVLFARYFIMLVWLQSWMVGWLMIKMIMEGISCDFSYSSGIILKQLRKNKKMSVQDSPCWDLNWAPLKQKSTAVPHDHLPTWLF
jgi:hypothetical protein